MYGSQAHEENPIGGSACRPISKTPFARSFCFPKWIWTRYFRLGQHRLRLSGLIATVLFHALAIQPPDQPDRPHSLIAYEGGSLRCAARRARASALGLAALLVPALGPAVEGLPIDSEDLRGVNLVAARNPHDFVDVLEFEFAERESLFRGQTSQVRR